MKYTFKDMLNAEMYESARVVFILGKHNLFNNLVSDELRATCVDSNSIFGLDELSGEFGLDSSEVENINSVDFNTFMEVNGVANINGKWFCKTEYKPLTKKQRDQLTNYMKNPSDTGILVIESNDWKEYKEILRNKIISASKTVHSIELSFPNRDVLKAIVKQMFMERGIDIQSNALDLFLTKMSSAYEEYEKVIDDIKDVHGKRPLESKDLKVYMKGIEHFVLDDFVNELTKPLSSDKTNSKKVLKIMMALQDEMGAKNLVYQLLKIIDECIEFRILINTGYIPISLNYFFGEVIHNIGEDSKYSKMKEWTFRKKATLASQTSLRDWEYMKLILFNAIKNVKLSDEIIEQKCKRALYDICTRSVLTADRINNIVGIDNVLSKELRNLNNIKFEQRSLDKITQDEMMANME